MVDASYLKIRSKSPRSTGVGGPVERQQAKRYSSPQASGRLPRSGRTQNRDGHKMDLNGNGRAKRSQSKQMQEQLDKRNKEGALLRNGE